MEDKKLNELNRELYIVQKRLQKEKNKRLLYILLVYAIVGVIVSQFVVEYDGIEAILDVLAIIVACIASLSIASLLMFLIFSFITASFTNIHSLEDREKKLQLEIKKERL